MQSKKINTQATTQGQLSVYCAEPPPWLPKTHTSSDIGFLGFYPAYNGQPEDILSDYYVQNGYSSKSVVQAENFSTHEDIQRRLEKDDVLSGLEDLMNLVIARKADEISNVPVSTFKIPSRITLNDAKRQAWFADLANPDVPLAKLGKNVPHGAKGHDLLDSLHNHSVEVSRAVWFLRVFGANETTGVRNKPSYNPTKYSEDWALVMTSYLRKQLSEIALPSAPRPGLHMKVAFKGVLSDPESRERWTSRFEYSLELLRVFYVEGLVDNKIFLSWLIQFLGICNLAQAGFVIRLAEEFVHDMLGYRPLLRRFVGTCLARYCEMVALPGQDYIETLMSSLKVLLQVAFVSYPDSFVSPRMWLAHSEILPSILNSVPSSSVGHPVHKIGVVLGNVYHEIDQRNKAMIFVNLPSRSDSQLSSAVGDIQRLNNLDCSVNLDNFPFFPSRVDDLSGSIFRHKLEILLTWAVTKSQYGLHRPHIVVYLLSSWRRRAGDRANRCDTTPPDELMQACLFDWLDDSEIAGDESNVRSIAGLYGRLVQEELFSYAVYVQRLIARGDVGSNHETRHGRFLKWIPFYYSTPASSSQRKVLLYGARTRETPEDITGREIRKEIRAVLPEMFNGGSSIVTEPIVDISRACPTLVKATPFEQVNIFKHWFMPLVHKYVARLADDANTDAQILNLYSIVTGLIATTQCFISLQELSVELLARKPLEALCDAVTDNIRLYGCVWFGMGKLEGLVLALYAHYTNASSLGFQFRRVLKFLLEEDVTRWLLPHEREELAIQLTETTQALYHPGARPVTIPAVLPEIHLLVDDPAPEAPLKLAHDFGVKFSSSPQWAYTVWDNVVSSIKREAAAAIDATACHTCVLRYGQFVTAADKYIPDGFNGYILEWFRNKGQQELETFSQDVWDAFICMLLNIVVQGTLSIVAVLDGLVFPVWQAASDASEVGMSLEATNDLFHRLVILDEVKSDGSSPANLLELQRLRASRSELYRPGHFARFVDHIPTLVLLSQNMNMPQKVREMVTTIGQSICRSDAFREASYRNVDVVRSAFERPLMSSAQDNRVCQPLINMLRLILGDSYQSVTQMDSHVWENVSALLTPWKLAATTVQLQFTLRQTASALMNPATSASANQILDQLVCSIFKHTMTSEEAYFIAETMKGVDKAVATKFIHHGLQCMTETLEELGAALQQHALPNILERLSELLRILAYIAEPLRSPDLDSLPSLEKTTQLRLLQALSAELEREAAPKEPDVANNTELVILLARIVQFVLGFPGAWPDSAKDPVRDPAKDPVAIGDRMVAAIYRLILRYGSGEQLDISIFSMLLDTLYFLADEIPLVGRQEQQTSKTGGTIPNYFQHFPQSSAAELPWDMPEPYRRRLRALLPESTPNKTVARLSIMHREPSSTSAEGGELVYDGPVLNRPWEWMEYLGDPTSIAAREGEGLGGLGGLVVGTGERHHQLQQQQQQRDRRDREGGFILRPQVQNTASLELELFDARLTGERILANEAKEHASSINSDSDRADDSGIIENTLHTFQSSFASDSIFQRDWRETRVVLGGDGGDAASALNMDRDSTTPSREMGTSAATTTDLQSLFTPTSSRRGSPASSSVRSRTPTTATASITAGNNLNVNSQSRAGSWVGSRRPSPASSTVHSRASEPPDNLPVGGATGSSSASAAKGIKRKAPMDPASTDLLPRLEATLKKAKGQSVASAAASRRPRDYEISTFFVYVLHKVSRIH